VKLLAQLSTLLTHLFTDCETTGTPVYPPDTPVYPTDTPVHRL